MNFEVFNLMIKYCVECLIVLFNKMISLREIKDAKIKSLVN